MSQEVEALKDRMEMAVEKFRPTEEALQKAGIPFIHPAVEVEEDNLNRRTQMLEYRYYLAHQEEIEIAAEREEILKLRTRRACRTKHRRTDDLK